MIDGWTGIELLGPIQDFMNSLPSFVTTFFETMSSSLFYLAIPFLISLIFYWFIDKRAGDRIMINTIAAYNLVNFFKFIFKQPRPWVLDPSIQPTERALETAGGYSFPSGHSAIATAGYGTATLFTKRMWLKILFILILISILLARILLCVHTPLDVLFGILIAVVCICVNMKVLDFGDRNDNTFYFVSLMYIIVFSLFFISIILTMDQDQPNVMTGIGLFYGVFIGRVIERRYVHYDIPELKVSRKIMYAVIGIIGIGVFIGIPLLVLELDTLCCIGGIVTGIWIYDICPMMITKWK